jgi:large subunit ribosomal protein L17
VRHRVYGKHLGRNKNQRSALFKSLVRSLFIHQSIETTEPKAKAIKPLVDRIISNAKSATAKKLVSQFFNQKDVETKLTDEILPRMTNRISGYTSTVRLGRRMGDGAMLVKMSLLLEDSKKVSKSEAQSVKEEAIIEGEVVKEVKAKKTAKKGAK